MKLIEYFKKDKEAIVQWRKIRKEWCNLDIGIQKKIDTMLSNFDTTDAEEWKEVAEKIGKKLCGDCNYHRDTLCVSDKASVIHCTDKSIGCKFWEAVECIEK